MAIIVIVTVNQSPIDRIYSGAPDGNTHAEQVYWGRNIEYVENVVHTLKNVYFGTST